MNSPAPADIVVTGDFDPQESVWTSNGDANDAGTIGVEEDGELTVNGGSYLEWETFWLGEDSGATGTATLTGSGSRLDALAVFVGEDGTGHLEVLLGGGLYGTERVYIGYNPNSSGYLLVDGAESTLETDLLIVGDEGDGEFVLSGTALADVNDMVLGRLANSDQGTVASGVATVSGEDTHLDVQYDIRVGVFGPGNLTIESGALANAENVYLGDQEGIDGAVQVQGTDSRLEIGNWLYVGLLGTGQLTISDGAFVGVGADDGNLVIGESPSPDQNTDAMGTVTVTGNNSELNLHGNDIIVGDYGTGFMTVSDGALVEARVASIGDETGSIGTVIVESGATWDVDFIDVGPSGTGTMTVRDGGIVTTLDSTIGHGGNGTGTLTVQGDGSSWSQPFEMLIGFDGNGTLNVLDGGYVFVGENVTLSQNSGESVVNVAGAGSVFEIGGDLNVALDGDNSYMNVYSGGEVSVGGDLEVGRDNAGDGALSVRGENSVVNVTGNLQLGGFGIGALNLSEGGTVEAGGDVVVREDSTLNISVTGNNMLVAGADSSGNFSLDGTANLIASASLAAGTFTPISVSGSFFDEDGAYNGIGGTWNEDTHEFTVSAITTVAPADLSGARVQYGDSLVVSFDSNVGEQAFTVTELNIEEINSQFVLDAYDFDTNLAELTMLSFLIGNGYDEDTLSIWHLADGETEWELFSPSIIDYDGGYYAFSVDEFSSYAVTSTVPEPATGALVLAACGALAWRRRRNGEATTRR